MNKTDKYFENKRKCMFQEWYPTFKQVTFSSTIIPLPKIFIDYLNSDHFVSNEQEFPQYRNDDPEFLDDESWSTPRRSTIVDSKYYQSYGSDSDSDSDDSDDSNDDDKKKNSRIIKESEFQHLLDEIKSIITKYGGYVLPKLNWSAPKDATFMNAFCTLKCSTPTDVFLLLKSSDFINHDLAQFETNEQDDDLTITPYVLVLRKWQNLTESMEFRCFVKDKKLLGISQRDTSTYYSFLKDKKESIQESIESFFNQNIKDKFSQDSYTFDAYVTKENKVWLIDFNPIHPSTDSLLFDWEEFFPELIVDDEESTPISEQDKLKLIQDLEFRLIENREGIRPNLAMESRLPMDLKDSSQSSAINDLLEKFKDKLQ
ncbi:hypothetical protein CYY_000531 [Polysphondylium violaceum]|uniref:Cell division cycle protein 123 n=1 Tax=Polysphondylium violaceum TaxID=133409 RepID=A0A8J4Q4I5_9MYCE|nr:hypothetical protein CYY_000531 [Polysphondylium violaceum]